MSHMHDCLLISELELYLSCIKIISCIIVKDDDVMHVTDNNYNYRHHSVSIQPEYDREFLS